MERPALGGDGRCARFAPSECLDPRIAERFCMDRDAYTREGETVPTNFTSWSDARRVCESDGKRLCLESEWDFACEGEAMLPYPTGLERDHVHCKIPRPSAHARRGPRDVPRDDPRHDPARFATSIQKIRWQEGRPLQPMPQMKAEWLSCRSPPDRSRTNGPALRDSPVGSRLFADESLP